MTYDIHTDIKFKPLELIQAGELVAANTKDWWNQSLCLVNESVVRVGVFLGEFHWHAHEKEDELFFVLEGKLEIDIEGRDTIVMGPRQGVVVPRGVRHRTRAKEKTVVLMVEPASVVPTGDAQAVPAAPQQPSYPQQPGYPQQPPPGYPPGYQPPPNLGKQAENAATAVGNALGSAFDSLGKQIEGIRIGSYVFVRWSDGNRYPGTVVQIAPGQYLVNLANGQHWIPQGYVSLT